MDTPPIAPDCTHLPWGTYVLVTPGTYGENPIQGKCTGCASQYKNGPTLLRLEPDRMVIETTCKCCGIASKVCEGVIQRMSCEPIQPPDDSR